VKKVLDFVWEWAIYTFLLMAGAGTAMSLFLGKTWWTTGKGVLFWLACSSIGVAIVIPGKLKKKATGKRQ
jgi:hypothetical protein